MPGATVASNLLPSLRTPSNTSTSDSFQNDSSMNEASDAEYEAGEKNAKPGSSPASRTTLGSLPPQSPLDGIPMSYVIHRLHCLAPRFWGRPETADCTIIVPLPLAAHLSLSRRGSSFARRAAESELQQPPVILLPGPESKIFERSRLVEKATQDTSDLSDPEPTRLALNGEHRGSYRRSSAMSTSSEATTDSMVVDTSTAQTTPASPSPHKLLIPGSAPSRELLSRPLAADLRRGSAPAVTGGTFLAPGTPLQFDNQERAAQSSDPLTMLSYVGRGSNSVTGGVRRLTYRLHKDYLTAQSTLLRKVLTTSPPPDPWTDSTTGGANATQNMRDSSPALATSMSGDGQGAERSAQHDDPTVMPSPCDNSSRRSSATAHIPAPRFLASSAGGPVIYLPLPDPSSFSAIMHFLYFGDFSHLDSAMRKGTVRWEGVVSNTEYLGLDVSLKKMLGNWWRQFVAGPSSRRASENTTSPRDRATPNIFLEAARASACGESRVRMSGEGKRRQEDRDCEHDMNEDMEGPQRRRNYGRYQDEEADSTQSASAWEQKSTMRACVADAADEESQLIRSLKRM